MRRETKQSDTRVARKVMRASTKPFSHENCMTQEILMKKKAPELISLFKSKNQIKSTCFALITQGVVSQSPESWHSVVIEPNDPFAVSNQTKQTN